MRKLMSDLANLVWPMYNLRGLLVATLLMKKLVVVDDAGAAVVG